MAIGCDVCSSRWGSRRIVGGVAVEACYFIGDSDVDIFTAVNAGMHPVGVRWGFRPVEELREAGAETILETPADLLALLGGFHGCT